MKHRASVLAVDQGTTGTRAIVFSAAGKPTASFYQEFPQIFPKTGWVEHDALKIWNTVQTAASKVLKKISSKSISAIGITNQRETTILWDRRTGKPVHPAIVWQDRRTAEACENLRQRGLESLIRKKTGLVLDPYFSATKIAWLLEHVPGLRKRAERGDILFGTVDTWLLWNLTGRKVHATDQTNASRTLLFNIRNLAWDPELLKIFKIPRQLLPEVKPAGAHYGKTAALKGIPGGLPIEAMMGDQQAALYGQACYSRGQIKNTYGTGCFTVLNLGSRLPSPIPSGLLLTVACDKEGKAAYALEGSIFIGGAVIQWIRDGLKWIHKASETEAIANKVKDSSGVVFIPAFAGLGSPYWNPNARGMISGITRGTKREHIILAALESIAQQSADVVEQMKKTGSKVQELKVDGGATRNSFLMQLQADLLQIPVLVSEHSESTAWGVAKLAGHRAGIWKNLAALDESLHYRKFFPKKKVSWVLKMRRDWKKEIARLNS